MPTHSANIKVKSAGNFGLLCPAQINETHHRLGLARLVASGEVSERHAADAHNPITAPPQEAAVIVDDHDPIGNPGVVCEEIVSMLQERAYDINQMTGAYRAWRQPSIVRVLKSRRPAQGPAKNATLS